MTELVEPEHEAPKVAGKAPAPTARMDVINRTLTTMYHQKPLPTTYKELFEAAGYHPSTVSLALSTARDIGFTTLQGKKGLYNYTPQGEQYTRNLLAKRLDESKALLRSTLLANPLWWDVVTFLRANEGRPRDPVELTIRLETLLGKKWSDSMRKTVVDSLVSILEFSELVRVQSGKIVSVLGPNEGAFTETTGPAVEPRGMASADYYEFKDEGLYLKIRKDTQSVSLAKDFVDLIWKRHQHAGEPKSASESGVAPGTS